MKPLPFPLLLAVCILVPLASAAACETKFLIKYTGGAAYHSSVASAVKTSTSEVFTAGEMQATASTDIIKSSILKTNTMGVETAAATISHTSNDVAAKTLMIHTAASNQPFLLASTASNSICLLVQLNEADLSIAGSQEIAYAGSSLSCEAMTLSGTTLSIAGTSTSASGDKNALLVQLTLSTNPATAPTLDGAASVGSSSQNEEAYAIHFSS